MKSNETENRRKQVLEASLKGIRNFLEQFKGDNVYHYIYEGDLQAVLYNSIKSSLENCKLNYGEEGWFISERFGRTKTPCLVHCEQHFKGEEKKRIDIAVWDPTEENAEKHYAHKDLLFLIEIKYYSLAKWAIKEVKKDYEKLEKILGSEGWPKGLALTFTIDSSKNKKFQQEGNPIDVCEILKEKQIQALVACRDGIIEIPI